MADLVPYPHGHQLPHHVFTHELTGSSFLVAYSAIIALNFVVNAAVLGGAYAFILDHNEKKPGQLWHHAAWVTLGGWLLDGFALSLYRSSRFPFFPTGLPYLAYCGVLMAILLLVFNYCVAWWAYRLPHRTSWRIGISLALLTNPFYVVAVLSSLSLTTWLWQ